MRIFVTLLLLRATAFAGDNAVVVERASVCPSKNQRAREAFNRAYDATNQDDLETAERFYKEAIELDPRYCDAMDNLGQVYRRRRDDVNAALWYRKSIAIAPNNQVAHQSLAAVYIRAAKYSEAIAEYDVLIKLDPSDPEGPYGKGAALHIAGRCREAIAPITAAEALYAKANSPLVGDAQFIDGLCRAELGEWAKTIKLLEPLAPARDNDKRIHLALGRAYALGEPRDPGKARAHLERARALGASVPDELMDKVKR